MRERFTGKSLVEALQRQELIACDLKTARATAGKCKVIDLKQGTQFIREGAATNDVFLILQGTADIFVKGARVATRSEGQHVGEMAPLLNSRRTASVRATTDIVAAKIAGKQFLELGERFPSIWKGVARALAIRLDQRRNLIREPNIRPQIFIASSTKSKPIADALKKALDDPQWDIEVWDESQIFQASGTIIHTLADKAKNSDFGIIIFGRDDKTESGKQTLDSPRDNAVFEGGLFVGAVGLKRTYFVRPDGDGFKEPTDLQGVVTLRYRLTSRKIEFGQTVAKIRARIIKEKTR